VSPGVLNVLIVGDAAGAMQAAPSEVDALFAGARVARTVLRSEALRLARDGAVDVIVTASPAALLATPEFLAVFAGRTAPVSLLFVAEQRDSSALERLRAAGVATDTVAGGLERLRAGLRAAEARRTLPPVSANDAPSGRTEPIKQERERDSDMANVNKTLEETMKIDGAIGAALADWDSGLCLGAVGGGNRLNVEVAAAGNCQVVKAKMATMSELGIKGAIQDILITLDDQIHLIRPLKRGENLFLYLAIDKVKGNLGMARHRLQKLEAELNM
jgi:hypothetical protein